MTVGYRHIDTTVTLTLAVPVQSVQSVHLLITTLVMRPLPISSFELSSAAGNELPSQPTARETSSEQTSLLIADCGSGSTGGRWCGSRW